MLVAANVEAGASKDRHQPRPYALGVVERLDRPKGLEHGFLGEIVGLGQAVREELRGPEHGSDVRPHPVAKLRPCIPGIRVVHGRSLGAVAGAVL
jgi:hypothetical protein